MLFEESTRRCLVDQILRLVIGVASLGTFGHVPLAKDLSDIPIWDGETLDPGQQRLSNRFGGGLIVGQGITVGHTTAAPVLGKGAYRITANIGENDFGFFRLPLTGFGPTAAYVDSRSFSAYEEIQVSIRNRTADRFTLSMELKDYRDTGAHSAKISYSLGSADTWTNLTAPLPPAINNGWTIVGNPDLDRIRFYSMVFEANQGTAIHGNIVVDDLIVKESGAPLNIQTSSITALLERLSERIFRALWGCRDRNTGLLPQNSAFADVMALNVTATILKTLPRAINLGWIDVGEANSYVEMLIQSLNQAMDLAMAAGQPAYLPARYMDRLTLAANNRKEESPIDAALLFLALYQYKTLATTPTEIQEAIEALLDRFNFAAFSAPAGWKLAYLLDERKFTDGSYDGYSGEIYLMSLAGALARTNRIPITMHFHSGTNRTKAFLVHQDRSHMVHSHSNFRAPFLQWLFSLFIDTVGMGIDTYPDPGLAANPRANAILYQGEVHERLAELGRANLLQPDASDDGSGNRYEQFSVYNNFGSPDLFMPWSIGFSFLADPAFAGPALRNLLTKGLHGPFGLADSAHWRTGQPQPDTFPARTDLWNAGLLLMSLLEYLHDDSSHFTSLPEVQTELMQVFRGTSIDLTRTGNVDTISLSTEVKARYALEFRANLFSGDWTRMLTAEGTGGSSSFRLTNSIANGFYRVAIEQAD